MTTRWDRILAGALFACAAIAAAAQPRFQFDTTPGRLSKQVVPSRYELTLALDPARDDFQGHVAIVVNVRVPVAAIELHAQELQAAAATLDARALSVTPQPATQTWRLAPVDGQPVAPGAHRLEIDYRGAVHGYGDGLYRAPYGPGGRDLMLATQLEAIYARQLFPGFDEPAFRAAFDIRVRAPAAYDVVSNMPRVARTAEGATALHRFAVTPAMPTYLVSVAVGRFDALEGRAAGVPLRVLTAPGKRAQAQYAMQVTKQVLPYYTRYFGVPYALPKLDQLAVPSTRWGAMEDWGLISYSEHGLLYDPARSSLRTQRQVYSTIAHEIAHQWFGNLVTAASWEEIWLNEAFATWMQDKAMDRFNPSWDVRSLARRWVDEAMADDAGSASRAIRSGPVSETAVWDVFDSITYAKGGAVLGMLEQWIGEEPFRRGLAAYMESQRYSNATAGDLWHHIGRASGRDIGAVAASWTDQPGFPLVSVSSRCEGGVQRITLSQQRYDQTGAANDTALWQVPVRLSRGGAASTLLLAQREQHVDLGACSEVPVLVNAGGVGYYRVAYEAAQLDALVARFPALAPADRVTLLSDGFALMQSGRLPLASYIALVGALPRVTGASGPLWAMAVEQLDFLDVALAGTPAQASLHEAARALLGPQLARLGWMPRRGDDAPTLQLRATLIEQLARFDDAATVREALRLFDLDDAGTPMPSSIRAAVTLAVGRHADRARFDRLLARLQAANGEEDRQLYARALASGRDAERAAQLLDASLAGIAPSNIASAIPGFMAQMSPFGELAYRHVAGHWKRYAELAGPYNRVSLLPKAAAGFADSGWAGRLVDDQHREAGQDGDLSAAREAEAIRLRAAVRARSAGTMPAAFATGRAAPRT
jgi:aminopeptidase N